MSPVFGHRHHHHHHHYDDEDNNDQQNGGNNTGNNGSNGNNNMLNDGNGVVGGNPANGQPVNGQPGAANPVAGQPGTIDPVSGQPINPVSGQPINPVNGQPGIVNPITGQPANPVTGQPINPVNGGLVPASGEIGGHGALPGVGSGEIGGHGNGQPGSAVSPNGTAHIHTGLDPGVRALFITLGAVAGAALLAVAAILLFKRMRRSKQQSQTLPTTAMANLNPNASYSSSFTSAHLSRHSAYNTNTGHVVADGELEDISLASPRSSIDSRASSLASSFSGNGSHASSRRHNNTAVAAGVAVAAGAAIAANRINNNQEKRKRKETKTSVFDAEYVSASPDAYNQQLASTYGSPLYTGMQQVVQQESNAEASGSTSYPSYSYLGASAGISDYEHTDRIQIENASAASTAAATTTTTKVVKKIVKPAVRKNEVTIHEEIHEEEIIEETSASNRQE